MKRLLLLLPLFLLPLPVPAGDAAVESLRQTGKAFSSVARKVAPSVVFIQVEEKGDSEEMMEREGRSFHDDLFRRFFGEDFSGLSRPAPRQKRRTIGQGSGFVFAHGEAGAYVLTNHHVVERASRIRVRFQDGREFVARLKGADAKSDVAVLEIPARDLPALKWADSAALEVGEWVVALGNPFGLSHTLTTGVVSAKGRTSLGINDYEDFIQTDAAINPGNSGGPLLNLDGEVVGVNTAIFSRSGGYMGVGFAIPSNLARVIAEQLVRDGKVVRGYIGLGVQPLTFDLAEALNLRDTRGVLVSRVNPGSPAERAGIRAGDVLLSMDGAPLRDGGHYRNRAALAKPGSQVGIGLLREGRRMEIPVTVARLQEDDPPGAVSAARLGLAVRAASAEELRRLGVARAVVVVSVEPGSLAAMAGIAPGAAILEANRRAVGSPAEFATVVGEAEDGVLLRLFEQGRSRQVSLRWR